MKLFFLVAFIIGAGFMPAAAQSISSTTQFHADAVSFMASVSTQVTQVGAACSEGVCMVSWTPKAGVTTIVLDDKYGRLELIRQRISTLAQKVRNATATAAEKDELLWKVSLWVMRQE